MIVTSYTGLHYYEHVSIQIAAKTVVGWGPLSSEHYFFTSEDSQLLSVFHNLFYKYNL